MGNYFFLKFELLYKSKQELLLNIVKKKGTKIGMQKGKILIVDDNLMNIELLEETLEVFEYEILSYSNPVDAIKNTEHELVDLALIDVVMPQMDGFEFTKEFLKTHPNTPIVYVSAYGENEKKIKGYNTGSIVYIEKPFDIKTIRAQIQSILKLKKVQDELLEEKQKLDDIFEYSSNEIMLTDLHFNILSQNNKILPQSTITKNNFADFLKENTESEYIFELQKFVKSNKNHMQFRLFYNGKKYLKTTVSKVKSGGTPSGYLIIIEDLTEEIEKQNIITNFIEMITHDLKTPVRAEKRALKLLHDGSFGELNNSQKGIVQELLNSTRFMLRMTDNILTRYKIDSGECRMNKAPHSIKNTLQNCLDELEYIFESKNQTINITSTLTTESGNIFDYDEAEIHRVLTNVISNASEHSPQNTNINISLSEEGHNTVISVKDYGKGIPENVLNALMKEQIFTAQRFKKVGAGLGLYITKKIIDAHNGKIEIITNEDSGTTFKIYIPNTITKTPEAVQN